MTKSVTFKNKTNYSRVLVIILMLLMILLSNEHVFAQNKKPLKIITNGIDYDHLAEVYEDKGEYSKAIDILQKALKTNPKNAELYARIGNDYFYQGEYSKYDKAIQYLQKALKLNPKISEAYFGLGEIYNLGRSEYIRAIEYYQKGLKLNPNDEFYFGRLIGAYDSLADDYYYKSKYSKAIEFYNKAIRMDPNDGDAYAGLGWVYKDKKEYDKAINYCKKAIKLNPNEEYSYTYKAHAYHCLGLIYYDKGDYEQAIKNLKAARNADPYYNPDEIFYNMGDVYTKKRIYDKAIEFYSQSMEDNRHYRDAETKIGNIYYEKGDYDKAVESYQNQLECGYVDVSDFIERGNYKRAKDFYNNLISPEHRKTYYRLGILYNYTGKYGKAIVVFERLLKLNPNDPYMLMIISNSYLMNGNKADLQKATNAAQKALKSSKVKSELYYILGQVLYKQNLYAFSIDSYKMAISEIIKNPPAQTNLYKYKTFADIQSAIDAAHKKQKMENLKNKLFKQWWIIGLGLISILILTYGKFKGRLKIYSKK